MPFSVVFIYFCVLMGVCATLPAIRNGLLQRHKAIGDRFKDIPLLHSKQLFY